MKLQEIKPVFLGLEMDAYNVERYATLLELNNIDYHYFIFLFWTFSFSKKKQDEGFSLGNSFYLEDDLIDRALVDICSIEQTTFEFTNLEEMYILLENLTSNNNVVILNLDSMYLPYHWTAEIIEGNHRRNVIVVQASERNLYILDPGWFDNVHKLDEKVWNNNYVAQVKSIKQVKPITINHQYFLKIITILYDRSIKLDESNMAMLQRIEYFATALRNNFIIENEIEQITYNRSALWRNPLLSNLNQLSKHRIFVGNSFLTIFGEDIKEASVIGELFKQSGDKWQTIKFMIFHIMTVGQINCLDVDKMTKIIDEIIAIESDITYTIKEIIHEN